MSKTRKMMVFPKHSLLNKNNNTKKRKAQELICNILTSPTSCKNNCAMGVGHSFLSCAAKFTSTCAQATSRHLLPPINIFDCKTAGWDKTEETIMQLSDIFFGLWTKNKAGSSYSLLSSSVRVRSILTHYLTDMTVVLRSSATDQSDTQHPVRPP